MATIDNFRKYDTDKVLLLTWEVIEERGVEVGDLMALWKIAGSLALAAPVLESNTQDLVNSLIASGYPEIAVQVAMDYELLLGYIRRDVAELTKFLVRKNFHFPDLSDEDFK